MACIFAPVRKWYYILAVALLFPALLIHLGWPVFIDDEAIRALVAREMMWSGNYLAPTMHADAYLNKPPLWNWILAACFWLLGRADEWTARLPTVLSLLGFAATTFWFSRRHFGTYLAAVHALTVVTCGRMLFWDSMLGLIDVCFSWVIYTQIMVLYRFGSRGLWWPAFLGAYGLMAAAFLLKGLPAIVFQGLSVLAIVGWQRDWKQLFRPAHLVSGLLGLAVLGIYYLAYARYVDPARVATRLLEESSKRTPVTYGAWSTVRHLLSFPFAMAYHFLPWTLLLVYLLRRGSLALLRANDFAAFCLLAFAVNIPVYWLSPNVYPRYLLMLFPLLFGSLLWLHRLHAADRSKTYRVLRITLLTVMTLVAVLIPVAPLVPQTAVVTFPWWKSVAVGGAAGAVVVAGWRDETNFLLLFCCFLLILRIGFDWFVLPPRVAGDARGLEVRASARSVVESTRHRELLIYRHTLIEPATGWYLSTARGGVVPRRFGSFPAEAAYVVNPDQYPGVRVSAVDSLYLRHRQVRFPVGPMVDGLPGTGREDEHLQDGMGTGIPLRD